MTHDALQVSVQHLQQGNFDRAEETLRGLLRAEAGNIQAWCLLGRIRLVRGRPDEALALFEQASQLDPNSSEVHNLAGLALMQMGQADRAQARLEEALRLDPFHPEAYNNLGRVYLMSRRADEALACFRESVRLQPGNVDAVNNLALMLIGQRQLDEARPLLEQIVQTVPTFAGGHLSLSVLYFEQGDLEKALASAQHAMQLNPAQASGYSQLGTVLLKMGRYVEAIGALQAALRIAPQQPQTLEHLGLAHRGLGRLNEAESFLRQAAQLDPANPRVVANLTGILSGRQQWEEVIALASAAVQHNLLSHDLLHNLGLAYHHLKRPQQAIPILEQALQLQPSADTFSVLGWAYLDAGQPEEARTRFENALRLKSDSAEVLAGLAGACKDLALQDEAIAYYRKSLALKAEQPETHSALVFSLHYSPTTTPEEIFQEHRNWAARHAPTPPGFPLPHCNEPDPERRLRIGYLSADFCTHVVANYIELILQAHDRRRVEVFCYANVARPDAKTEQLQKLADHWRSVYCVGDDQAEQMMRQDQIDLLVDLAGHTGGSRLTLLARKPAPVLVTHFGYMNTTGLPTVDYRITDDFCDPPGTTERYHTEQLVRLPEVAWCYRPDLVLDVNPLPAPSAGHVTLGMFNNFPKATPQALDAWARIMKRLPGSRLLLVFTAGAKAEQRLRDTFAKHGIDPSRISTLGRQAGADYFRLYQRVDLTLDPFPYTGLYTTADSLWMGVPVITRQGPTYITRQAASLLALAGLPELIAQTVEEYVESAVRLGTDLSRLASIRAGLRERLSNSPLMNPERYTRQLEDAYRGMWRQWCARI